MDLQLADKVAVVTGASKGIGLAVARTLAAEGATVVAGSRTVETLAGIERVTPVAVDLVDRDGPARLIATAVDTFGTVDVLVNNVGGVHPRLKGFLSLGDEDFEGSLQLNFFAALRATRAAVADMSTRGAGVIVNVASVNAFFEPDSAVIDYGAAKAALLNVAKSLSQELGPQGIRITSVSPGPVATDLWLGNDGVAAKIGQATGAGSEAIRAQAVSGVPVGRFTTPDEVAAIVALLASPRAGNVTGASWVIDGGLVKTTWPDLPRSTAMSKRSNHEQPHHRPHPRTVDDPAELGALDRSLPGSRPRGAGPGVAGAGRRHRAAPRRPERHGAPRPRRDRRPLRGDHPGVARAADHHGALVRRRDHGDPA